MNTPPDIVRAAYVDLVVTDLAKARAWWVDLIGFHVEEEQPGALYLRGYEEFIHHSVVLREGPQAACQRMGFRVRTPDDVDRAERYFNELGCPTRRVPAGTTPGFGEAVRTVDPLGFTIELVHHIDHVEPLVQRYDLRHGASINRLDHINIATPDVPVAFDVLHRSSASGSARRSRIRRRHAVRGVDVPQADRARRRLHARVRARCIHHIAFAVPESHNIFSLCDTIGALDLQASLHRTRARPARRVERVLPLPARPRRPPRRDLHDRLLHR